MKPLGREAGARILAFAVALIAAMPLLAWLESPIHRPQDEGMLLVYPELIRRGRGDKTCTAVGMDHESSEDEAKRLAKSAWWD